MNSLQKQRLIQYGIDLLSLPLGAALVCSFAPFHWDILAIISPGAATYIWLKSPSTKRAVWRGLLFGIGEFGFGISWVYVSISRYGNTTPLVAIGCTSLFVLANALCPIISAYILKRWFNPKALSTFIFAFPAVWTIIELIQGTVVLGGFPWLLLGYSQTHSLLSGYAPLLGVYGVTLIVCLCAGLFIALLMARGWRQLVCFICLFGLAIIGFGLNHIDWTHRFGARQKVVLVQGNIAQNIKWQSGRVDHILSTYWQLSRSYLQNSLIFWPENATPVFQQQAPKFYQDLNRALLKQQASLLTGLPIYHANTKQYFNGAKVFGIGHGTYLKHQLVPFGEYVPFAYLFGKALQFLHIPMSNFTSGPAIPTPIEMDGHIVDVFICYEIAFSRDVRRVVSHIGPSFIAVLSDDGWFGQSLGPFQQAQISQMQALSTGKYIVTSTNNGMTTIIDNKGNIIKSIPPFQAGVLVGKIKLMRGETPWVQYGFWPIGLILGLFVLLGLMGIKKRY